MIEIVKNVMWKPSVALLCSLLLLCHVFHLVCFCPGALSGSLLWAPFSVFLRTLSLLKVTQPSRRVYLWSSVRVENKGKKNVTHHNTTLNISFLFVWLEILFNRFKCRGSAQGWQKLPSELIKVHSDTVTFTCSFATIHTQEDSSNGLSVMRLASWHSLNCNYGTKSAPCFALANWPRHSIIALSCGQAPLNWKLFFFSPSALALFGPTPVHIGSRVYWPCVCFNANLTTCRWWNPCQGGFGEFWCAESSAGLC